MAVESPRPNIDVQQTPIIEPPRGASLNAVTATGLPSVPKDTYQPGSVCLSTSSIRVPGEPPETQSDVPVDHGQKNEIRIVGPSEDGPRGIEGWKSAITERFESFPGDPENAASLMVAMEEGRTYITDKLGETEVEIPKIAIVTEAEDFQLGGSAAYVEIGGILRAIFVSHDRLAEHSHFNADEPTIFDSLAPGNPVLTATTRDFWRLNGVEEAHHAAFHALRKDEPPVPLLPATTSFAEYVAQENEWQALHYKIAYAKEQGMPPTTIQQLEEIRDMAKAVREAQGLRTDRIHLVSQKPSDEVDL